MNVAGLEEALLYVVVETIDDLELRVINEPAKPKVASSNLA